jgi:hypothetical protein
LVVLEESTSVDLVVDEKIVHLSSYDSEAVNENHVIELNLGSRVNLLPQFNSASSRFRDV